MDRHQLKLNADLGEGAGNDEALMPYLEMCNISCGAHAGGVAEIEKTIRLALKQGVKIGAHPSYPDRINFGRQVMKISMEELCNSLTQQLKSFKSIANNIGAKVNHIKAHGALYHQVVKDQQTKDIFIRAIDSNFKDVKIVLPSSYYGKVSTFGNHKIVYEAFADRQYMPNLEIMSRNNEHAVLTKTEDLASQLYKLLDCAKVFTEDGSWQDIHFDTICIHGDTKGIAERLPAAISLLKNHNY